MASSPDLRERLQGSLGATYTIERELGGGGMSRVSDPDLGRSVIVKVLPPDAANGISVDRRATRTGSRMNARVRESNERAGFHLLSDGILRG